MKIILNVDVKGTGKKGQLVEVSDGYANNFLLATGKAKKVTNSSLNEHEGKASANAFHEEKRKEQALEIAKKLKTKTVTLKVKCGDAGRIFGSVTSKEISDELLKIGVDVDKKKIELKEPIKAVGNYSITAKLYPGVSATFGLVVEAE